MFSTPATDALAVKILPLIDCSVVPIYPGKLRRILMLDHAYVPFKILKLGLGVTVTSVLQRTDCQEQAGE